MRLVMLGTGEQLGASAPVARAVGFEVVVATVDQVQSQVEPGCTLLVDWAMPEVARVVQSCRASCHRLRVLALVGREQVLNNEHVLRALFECVDDVLVTPLNEAEVTVRLWAAANRHEFSPGLEGTVLRERGGLSQALMVHRSFDWVAQGFKRLALELSAEPRTEAVCVHVPLVLTHAGLWLDLVLSAEVGARPVLRAVTAFINNLVGRLEGENAQLLRPGEPVAFSPAQLPTSGWSQQFECGAARLELRESHIEVQSRIYGELQVGDVLLEPLFLPGSNGVQLIEPATLIKAAYLKRLAPFVADTRDDAVMVVAASELSRQLRLS